MIVRGVRLFYVRVVCLVFTKGARGMNKRKMVLSSIGLIFWFTIYTNVYAKTVTLNATRDIWTTSVYAYDDEHHFSGCGGGLNNEVLRVGGWADYYYSLLLFDLSTVKDPVKKATLRLYNIDPTTETSSPAGIHIERLTRDWDWTTQPLGSCAFDNERLWWVNRPSYTPYSSNLPAPPRPGYWEADVTAFVEGVRLGSYTNFGLQLRPTSINNNFNNFSSTENATLEWRPKLIIETTTATATTSASCPPDEFADLANQDVTDTRVYQACKTLASGPFTVSDTAKVTFYAGQRITLRPGFRVERGGVVTARILPDLQMTPDAEIRAVQFEGADGNNRYDLFVGQGVSTGPAQVDLSEGMLKSLGFTLLSGPAGLAVDSLTGAIRFQPPPAVTAGSYAFLIRVTYGTSTLEVTGDLQLTLAQQVETAVADGVTPILLGDHLVEIDGNALPTGTAVSLRTGSTADGERFITLTLPAQLAEGTYLRLDLSELVGTAPTVEENQEAGEVAGLTSVDGDCPEYAPRLWQSNMGFFDGGMYRWPPRLLAEVIEIPWWALNPLIGPSFVFTLFPRTASVLCSEYDSGSPVLQTDAQPVLFVHGYTLLNFLGGGSKTWGRMVAELRTLMDGTASAPKILPFEFRWRTNARFEDVAAELKEAVDAIKSATGKNVHIVAHSFGGILVRTYLQGLADTDVAYSTPVASVTTIGTPHSGIFSSSNAEYPDGTDQSVGGLSIGGCAQISCFQAGNTISDSFVEWLLGADVGSIIRDLKDGNYPFLSTDLPVQVLIGLRTWVDNFLGLPYYEKITITDGDGLISFDGQRFLPGDRNEQELRRDEQIIDLRAKVSEYVIAVDTIEPDLEGLLADSSFPGFSHNSSYLDDGTFDGVRALQPEVMIENTDHEVLPYLSNWIYKWSSQPPFDHTEPLNDTGLDWCANTNQKNLACPISSFPGQDAEYGRDATYNDDSDGQAGFSFTKISNSGNSLPNSAALGSGTNDWACTRDTVTGLIWEVKTDDGGMRDKDWTYLWYNPDAATNGGFAGYPSSDNRDTFNFVADINRQGLCGATDWRLPNRFELESITSNDRANPAIDTSFFPNTQTNLYWSSSPYALDAYDAWTVHFGKGSVYNSSKGYYSFYTRLVRGGY
jgi:pimeloyl-ACP methyl ester carboxylesterase